MPDGIDVSSDIEPIVELVGLLHFEGARADRFVSLRSQQARGWAATEQYAKQLDRLYEDIARSGHNADWLVQAADLVGQSEGAQRERLRPGIEVLKEKLAAHRVSDAEARRIIEEGIAIGEAWLSLPAALHKKLLQLAADRRAAAEEIRRARPVEGDIDYAELSREHIARYPKIRAALAK
jgi:uncharacterized membrane protein